MKKLVIGSDNAGFGMKEMLKKYLSEKGYEMEMLVVRVNRMIPIIRILRSACAAYCRKVHFPKKEF